MHVRDAIRRWAKRTPLPRTLKVIADKPRYDGVQFIKQCKHL